MIGAMMGGRGGMMGVAGLLTQAGIYIPQKMFIPQTRLNLVCGINIENNGPITRLFLFTNDKIMPSTG
jgi:hypothetical protein